MAQKTAYISDICIRGDICRGGMIWLHVNGRNTGIQHHLAALQPTVACRAISRPSIGEASSIQFRLSDITEVKKLTAYEKMVECMDRLLSKELDRLGLEKNCNYKSLTEAEKSAALKFLSGLDKAEKEDDCDYY